MSIWVEYFNNDSNLGGIYMCVALWKNLLS